MKYIYGPIKSRRLGLSLGVSLSANKVCDLDCIYCQWGSVGKTVFNRAEYVPADKIILELKYWLQQHPQTAKKLEFITLSGLGEPTLNTCIGALIKQIKEITGLKIAVITNSTLLGEPEVRKGLLKADLIVPSLDAVDPEVFKQIDRPHPVIRLESMIDGLIALRKEFSGQIWLEIMFILGVNDRPEHIAQLLKIIPLINPDRIQLNSPVRSTAEKNVLPVETARLEQIKKLFGDKAEII